MKKIILLLVTAAMTFSIAACGDQTSDSNQTAEAVKLMGTKEAAQIEEEELSEEDSGLIGVWESDLSEDGSLERITINGETVTVDLVNDDQEETYWVGSYDAPSSAGDMIAEYTWVSLRDEDSEMKATEDEIEFTYTGTAADSDSLRVAVAYTTFEDDGTVITHVAYKVAEEAGMAALAYNSDSDASEETGVGYSGSDGKNSTGIPVDSTNGEGADKTDASAATESRTGDSKPNTSTAEKSGENSSTDNSGNKSSDSGSDNSAANAGPSSGKTTTACSHTYNSGTVTKAATCTSAGTKTYTCTKCGATKTESISVLGHSYNGGTVTTQATCGSSGVMTYACTRCGNTYTSAISATGNHSWNPVYKTVHHDEVGHYETKTIRAGVTICNACGAKFYNYNCDGDTTEICLHIKNVHNGKASWSCDGYEETTQTWVVDKAAYDETVIDHYACSVCSAVK